MEYLQYQVVVTDIFVQQAMIWQQNVVTQQYKIICDNHCVNTNTTYKKLESRRIIEIKHPYKK